MKKKTAVKRAPAPQAPAVHMVSVTSRGETFLGYVEKIPSFMACVNRLTNEMGVHEVKDQMTIRILHETRFPESVEYAAAVVPAKWVAEQEANALTGEHVQGGGALRPGSVARGRQDYPARPGQVERSSENGSHRSAQRLSAYPSFPGPVTKVAYWFPPRNAFKRQRLLNRWRGWFASCAKPFQPSSQVTLTQIPRWTLGYSDSSVARSVSLLRSAWLALVSSDTTLGGRPRRRPSCCKRSKLWIAALSLSNSSWSWPRTLYKSMSPLRIELFLRGRQIGKCLDRTRTKKKREPPEGSSLR